MKPIFAKHTLDVPALVHLTNVHIASPCPADWEKMVGDECVRHCAECNLNVYNLSAMTERQVQQLIAVSRGKRLCTRFYRRADGTILTQDCPWSLRSLKRRASRIAAAVLAGMMSIGVAFGKNNTQQSSNQQTANRQAKAGVWIMVLDPQGALVGGAEVRLICGGRIRTAHHHTPVCGRNSMWTIYFPSHVVRELRAHIRNLIDASHHLLRRGC